MPQNSSGIVADPVSLIESLRNVLSKYTADDMFREVVQNADDAEAHSLMFILLEQGGGTHTDHILLRGPALLIYNDGPLLEKDVEGIVRLIGGSKQDDGSKIGRFGLGLKSLFHVCEGFFFDAFPRKSGKTRGMLFDPWKQLRTQQRADVQLPAWDDQQCGEALEYIQQRLCAVPEFSANPQGFVLYIPLRSATWAEDWVTITSQGYTCTEFWGFMEPNIRQLVLSLAQCAYLRDLTVYRAKSLDALHDKNQCYRAVMTDQGDHLSRPQDNDPAYKQAFSCEIKTFSDTETGDIWHGTGVECFAPEALIEIVQRDDWPQFGVDLRRRCPAKAVPHAAVSVLWREQTPTTTRQGKVFMRWASFLPFDDRPAPVNMAEQLPDDASIKADWNVLLHGYFWPADDRKSLRGLTIDTKDSAVEKQWNRELARQILLPLLPEALEQVLIGRSAAEQQALVRAVRRWSFYERHKNDIYAQFRLVHVASAEEAGGADVWQATSSPVLTIPTGFPAEVGRWLATQQDVICFQDEGFYGPEHVQTWSNALFEGLLSIITGAKLRERLECLDWLREFLQMRERENSTTGLSEVHKDILGKWLFALVQDRVFQEKSVVPAEVQKKIIDLATLFMQERVFLFPKKTEFALKDLASGTLSSRYVLLPSADDAPACSLPDEERKRLLRILCQELRKQVQHEAYITLADKLCLTEHDPEFDDVPMYRVTVFAGEKPTLTAKSYQELHEHAMRYLVFLASPRIRFADNEMHCLSAALDIGTEVWRVSEGSVVPSGIAFGTTEEAPWKTVLENPLCPDPKHRLNCIRSMIDFTLTSETARAAVRALLAGKRVDDAVCFVIGGKSQYAVIPELHERFIAIDEHEYPFLSREHQHKLKIVEPHAVAAEQLEILLSSPDAWTKCAAILDLYAEISQAISKELREQLRQSAWIPANRGQHGYAPPCILALRDGTLQALLADSLPECWTTREGISTPERFAEILDALGQKEHDEDQLLRLFEAPDFRMKIPLLPATLQVGTALFAWLKNLSTEFKKTPEGDLLCHLLTLPESVAVKGLQKCCGVNCDYEVILEAACKYHIGQKSLPPEVFAELVDILYGEFPDIFTSSLRFPTRKLGVWKIGAEIACTDTGVDDECLLEQQIWIRHRNRLETSPSGSENIITERRCKDSADILREYFAPEACQAERYRLAVLVTLLAGNNPYVRQYGAELLQKHKEGGEQWQSQLHEEFDDDILDVGVHVVKTSGEPADALKTLSGALFTGKRNFDKGFFEYVTSELNSMGGKYYKIKLLSDTDGRCPVTDKESFRNSLKTSFFWWGKRVELPPKKLDKLWDAHSETQVSLAETANILRNSLHVVLAQFKLDKSLPISSLLMELREVHGTESPSAPLGESQKLRGKMAALQTRLWDAAIAEPAVYTALLQKIQAYSYREGGVLLELLQNADDALRDAASIPTTPLCTDVNIELDNGILVFTHHGRPINECGPDRVQAWSWDLYNMLQLNLSDKPDDHSVSTGKLGLGFKSVHLLCLEPRVQSADLCFTIKNGMFPVEITPFATENDPQATTFALELKGGVQDKLFVRFDKAARLLPVFAHAIRHIRVNKDGIITYLSFEPSPLGESGWIRDDKAKVLCFHDSKTTMTLAMGWAEGLPATLPESMPKLWNTLPTESGEDWGLGYALNGPFQLDPGRAHIVCDEVDIRLCRQFGEALGEALCRYSSWVVEHDPENVARHTAALWNVLTTGLATIPEEGSPPRRLTLLKALHTQGRGLSHWLKNCPVVGHGLPEGWSVPLECTSVGWNASSCAEVPEFGTVVQDLAEHMGLSGLAIVSPGVGKVLRFLGERVTEHVDAATIFTRLFERVCKNNKLTPEVFHRLAPLTKYIPDNLPFAFQVRTSDSSFVPIKDVLMPTGVKNVSGSSDFSDELMRATFAPETNLLQDEYIVTPAHLACYIRLRAGHRVDVKRMAEWIVNCTDTKIRRNQLEYLLNGDVGDKTVRMIHEDYPNSWLRDINIVECLINGMNQDNILPRLFPEHWTYPVMQPEGETPPTAAADIPSFPVLDAQNLLSGWNTSKNEIQRRYIAATWPEKFRDGRELKTRLEEKDQEAWLVLLLLGYLQSIGRTKPEATRNFVSGLSVVNISKMKGSDARWVNLLCDWQDQSIQKMEYRELMTSFPGMHQLTRFLSQYIGLFQGIPRRLEHDFPFESMFALRAAGDLSGTGKHTDAPPLPLNIGRYWVLRELVRLNVWEFQQKEVLFPYCWVPREVCLRRLGVFDGTSSNAVENQNLVDALTLKFGTLPTFDYWFDIALSAEELQ